TVPSIFWWPQPRLDFRSVGAINPTREDGLEIRVDDGKARQYRKLVIHAGKVCGAILIGHPDLFDLVAEGVEMNLEPSGPDAVAETNAQLAADEAAEEKRQEETEAEARDKRDALLRQVNEKFKMSRRRSPAGAQSHPIRARRVLRTGSACGPRDRARWPPYRERCGIGLRDRPVSECGRLRRGLAAIPAAIAARASPASPPPPPPPR